MSRFTGEVDSAPILNAANHWRERALLGGQSVLSSDLVWTENNIELLNGIITGERDDTDRSFLQKLEQALEGCPETAKKLAAEIMWLLLLCPRNV